MELSVGEEQNRRHAVLKAYSIACMMITQESHHSFCLSESVRKHNCVLVVMVVDLISSFCSALSRFLSLFALVLKSV